MVDEPDVNEDGLKLALAPAGRPLALKPTLLLNPFEGVTVAMYVVPPAAVIVCDDGVADTVKSGEGVDPVHAPSALATFNRPPVTVRVIDGIGSTFDRIAFRRPVVSSAHLDSTRAAAPETWGVAM